MQRTVPNPGNDEINLYLRTFYSLLRASDAIKIQALEEIHKSIQSSLHIYAHEAQIDISALIYSTLRLPTIIHRTDTIVLGQHISDFQRAGFGQVEQWEAVVAHSRRRRTYFNGTDTLATMIASRSDIEDLIPTLVALQIEWNKVHQHLVTQPDVRQILLSCQAAGVFTQEDRESLAKVLLISEADVEKLQRAWQADFLTYLIAMSEHKLDLSLYLLAGSQTNYRKAVGFWWNNLNSVCQTIGHSLIESPVYFVSSNTHSIPNLLSGFTRLIENDLRQFINEENSTDIRREWNALQAEPDKRSQENFFYYILKKYAAQKPDILRQLQNAEEAIGLQRIPAEHGFDVEAQLICLSKLEPAKLDPRLRSGLEVEKLAESDAFIINIDYPLGMAAYEILTRTAEGTAQIRGIYSMGKAATLNGRVGDVMLVNVVYDEHSANSYLFENCFRVGDITPYLCYGMLLDYQKGVTVRGTYLQNRVYMDVFYDEGYTVLEMEAGPYLSAVYEMIRPKRHPTNEIVTLYGSPFDIGFIHYASDTPFTKGHNLGASNLGYRGIDATYAASIAILRRIFQQEIQHLQSKSK